MNPVLILSYNNLEALKKCVESVRAQDVPTYTLVYDNGSNDGTSAWLPKNDEEDQSFQAYRCLGNTGVSQGWNFGLRYLFRQGYEHVLVLNQDTILGPSFYRRLLSHDLPFVTGCPAEAPDVRDNCDQQPERLFTSPCFSAFLIRRDCWEAVGPFDKRMFSWASDCDYHVRAHLLGIKLQMAEVPFAHRAGTTIRTAPPEKQKWFSERANADRAVFKSKWGCDPGTPEYDALFAPELFGIKKIV